jgi:hypothetical protein
MLQELVGPRFEISFDGRRFLVIKDVGVEQAPNQVAVVQN